MIIPAPADLAGRYRITNGSRFRLKDIDPNDSWGKRLKPIADELLKQTRKKMAGLQERLYAQDRWSILLIFQAMDAAGKDGTIKHVMSGVNPQGCDVHAFKAPSSEELDHDFLWRTNRRLPRRVIRDGRCGSGWRPAWFAAGFRSSRRSRPAGCAQWSA